jgi:DNA-binding NarL/FixJ family response regulator
MQSSQILVVEDHEAFRQFIRLALQQRAEFQIVGEASNGLEAVQKAQELQPDVVLLDIGLPTLNGLEAGRRIREVSPNSRILFLTQESSCDIVEEALNLGARGYVLKARGQNDLLPAIDALLEGKRFVSKDLEFSDATHGQAPHCHEVVFYSDDEVFLDSLTRFIAVALKAGNAAIALVTESHRASLFQRLSTQGVDIDAAVQREIFVAWDVRDALSTFMVNDWPDAVRLSTGLDTLVKRVSNGSTGERRRVVTCGECAPTLWAEGKVEAAIRVEQLWDKTTRGYGIDTLCLYPSLPGLEDDHSVERLCAEHTAVHSA